LKSVESFIEFNRETDYHHSDLILNGLNSITEHQFIEKVEESEGFYAIHNEEKDFGEDKTTHNLLLLFTIVCTIIIAIIASVCGIIKLKRSKCISRIRQTTNTAQNIQETQ
jgi:hypothetical protein